WPGSGPTGCASWKSCRRPTAGASASSRRRTAPRSRSSRRREAGVKVGAIFPQAECGTDVGALAAFARDLQAMGFSHLLFADHVPGPDPAFPSNPSLATYSHRAAVHEALTLMAYLAAVTSRMALATGILILPQRQTALVAKQAAELDVLSGGRLR